MRKKVTSLCLVAMMFIMMSLNAFAASGVNADEQRILDALSKSATTTAGVSLKMPSEYVVQAETYLKKDGVDLTADQADQVIAKVNVALELIAATSATRLAEIPADTQSAIIKLAQEAANVIGLTLTYDAATGVVTIVSSSTGSTVATSGTVVKQTGSDFNMTWIICGLLVGALLVCGVYAKKSNLFLHEETLV